MLPSTIEICFSAITVNEHPSSNNTLSVWIPAVFVNVSLLSRRRPTPSYGVPDVVQSDWCSHCRSATVAFIYLDPP